MVLRNSILLFFLLSFSLAIFLPGIAKIPVIDRDEAHFAQASRQMLQTNNFFQVRFQDTTRFQKPPGINWLQAASVYLLSNSETNKIWPYRFPSLLGALISVILTFYFSRSVVSLRSAALASTFLASSLLLLVEAHMAVIDTSLLSSILLMQWALWVIYEKGINYEKASWIWAFLFWLAMAYGTVLKGVSPLVGFFSIFGLCLVERRIDWLRGLHLAWGLLAFMALSFSWLMMLNVAEHKNYLFQMLQKDLLPKLKGGHESHGKPPLFHLIILPLTFWPASLFLWQGVAYAIRNRQHHLVKFLLIWIIPTWVFFELMPTKLPQYVLPTFPALALLCSLGLESDANRSHTNNWLRFLLGFWFVLSLGLILSLTILPVWLAHDFSLTSLLLFSSGLILSSIAVYLAWRGQYRGASATILTMALIIYPLVFKELLPQLKPLWVSSTIVKLLDTQAISKQKPLLVVGYEEPSLVFNLNTQDVKFSSETSAKKMLQGDASRIALVDGITLSKWQEQGFKLDEIAKTRGYNYSKGRWLDLFLLKRKD